MSAIAVRKEWKPILSLFGEPQKVLDKAVRHFLISNLSDRIEDYEERVKKMSEKFGGTFETISQTIREDESYCRELDQKNPTWESDLLNWEYDQKELDECTQNLENVLSKC